MGEDAVNEDQTTQELLEKKLEVIKRIRELQLESVDISLQLARAGKFDAAERLFIHRW